MASLSNLKSGDRVIYYGYDFPRRRGELCKVNAISTSEKEAVIIFRSDRLCISCNIGLLKKVEDNGF